MRGSVDGDVNLDEDAWDCDDDGDVGAALSEDEEAGVAPHAPAEAAPRHKRRGHAPATFAAAGEAAETAPADAAPQAATAPQVRLVKVHCRCVRAH